ncbi:uncharacterized protein LOC130426697 isoform X2 [Triplophysa dalaica]|uniref:uncharacterized protein LOC130426697 isoform X2 n=1 Tax=Triplophysa dalaica TaxID=1582913 RepID=UPI0024DF89EF|nr:uncharacterized protein LOC130426697 isoform X2 [Triplophysa dalaica]
MSAGSISIAEHPSNTDQSFLINLYDLHLKVIEQEYEIAILKAFNSLFHQLLFLDHIAVEGAEERINDIKEKLPSLERIVLEEEKKMDYYTGLLSDVIVQTQEACSTEDEIIDETQAKHNSFTNQIPTAAPEKLHQDSQSIPNESQRTRSAIRREDKRERGGEDIQYQLMEEIALNNRTEDSTESTKKKTCGCFSCLRCWR